MFKITWLQLLFEAIFIYDKVVIITTLGKVRRVSSGVVRTTLP